MPEFVVAACVGGSVWRLLGTRVAKLEMNLSHDKLSICACCSVSGICCKLLVCRARGLVVDAVWRASSFAELEVVDHLMTP